MSRSDMGDVSGPDRFSDRVIRNLYRIAYRGHMVVNFVLRPRTQGAYVAVWRDGKLLLIRNSYKTTYTLPCGGIGAGEEALDAARRELREEVGLELPAAAFQRAFETVNGTEFKRDHIVLFEVRPETPPVLVPDGREVVWAGYRTPADALELPLFPPVREYLLQRMGQVG